MARWAVGVSMKLTKPAAKERKLSTVNTSAVILNQLPKMRDFKCCKKYPAKLIIMPKLTI